MYGYFNQFTVFQGVWWINLFSCTNSLLFESCISNRVEIVQGLAKLLNWIFALFGILLSKLHAKLNRNAVLILG